MALESLPKIAPALFSSEQDLIQVYNKKTDSIGVINPSYIKSSPSGSAGAIQFSDGSAFASSSNLFWDNTNSRLGIGTSSPISVLQVKTTQANTNGSIAFLNNAAATIAGVKDDGSALTLLQFRADNYNFADATNGVLIGGTYGSTSTARLQVKGTGSTSATTSLLVQNSGGTELFKTNDDGTSRFANGEVIINKYVVGGLSMQISNTGHNNATGLSVTSAIGIKAYSTLGAYVNTPDGASIVAYGGGILGKSVGLRSNRAIISAGYAMDIVDSAMLQVDSTTQGFLCPRMTTAQKNAISSPAAGLQVYDTDLNRPCFYSGSAWVTL